jgi:GntR family transcriptional regulator of arabinose operon
LRRRIDAGEIVEQLPAVSRLADEFEVTPVTMHRALGVLKDRGYVYAINGRGTFVSRRRRPRTCMIGAVLHTTQGGALHTQLIEGIHEGARAGARGTTFEAHDGDAGREHERVGEMIERERVDGLILWPADPDGSGPTIALLKEKDVPFVLVPEPNLARFRDCNTVSNDDSGAATSVVGHLVGLGHRRIGFVCEERLIRESAEFAGHRRARYERVMAGAGLPVLETIVAGSGPRGGELDEALIERLRGLSAAVCVTDGVAVEVLRHCLATGIRVPDDLAVTGYDNSGPAGQLGLTSVEQHFEQIGETAVELLIEDIEHRLTGPVHANVPSELLLRQSTLGWTRRGAHGLTGGSEP